MNRGDVKLVIDQLDQYSNGDEFQREVETAVDMLEQLGNQVAQQAAVIEKLTAWLGRERCYYLDAGSEIDEEVVDFLLSPTDSKQILAEWLDSVLGEPAGITFQHELDHMNSSPRNGAELWQSEYERIYEELAIPLFKKPEIK